MELYSLKKALREEAESFSMHLNKIRTIGCVNAAYSNLLGSQALLEARNLYENNVISKKIPKGTQRGISKWIEWILSNDKRRNAHYF